MTAHDQNPDVGRRAMLVAAAALALPAQAVAQSAPDQPSESDVTPEMFGAKGDGMHDDTSAWQRAAATGRIIRPRPGAVYLLSATVEPPPGEALVILGGPVRGRSRSTIKADPRFRGYLLKPSGSYDIRGLCLVGNGSDGCFLLGSAEKGSAGFAILDCLDLRSADVLIHFGSQWEHPLFLSYSRLYGQHFRTGGIVLGGVDGSASSGESAWSFASVVMTNAGAKPIEPSATPHVERSEAGDADTISWPETKVPMFGWLVMRSFDGVSNWQVPPNLRMPFVRGTRFTAQASGQDAWHYKVVRQTVGISIRRAKAVSGSAIQAEYCGIGLLLSGVIGFDFQTVYYETRLRGPNPLPALAAVATVDSFGTISSGWIEQASYGVFVTGRSAVTVGTLVANDLAWALVGSASSEGQTIMAQPGIVSGSTQTQLRKIGAP